MFVEKQTYFVFLQVKELYICLLYTSDAADD